MQVLTKFFLQIVKIYDVIHILIYYISNSSSFLMIRLKHIYQLVLNVF
jgi:hypothetical protein